MSKNETGVQLLLSVLSRLVNEGEFPGGKPTLIKDYLTACETAEIAILSLELADEEYFQSILVDYRSMVSRLFNRMVSLQKIDAALVNSANELLRLIKSIELALRATTPNTSSDSEPLDRNYIIEFCTSAIAEISSEEMDPLLKGAWHIQLAGIRRMAEMPNSFSDRDIQKETKILMADLLHDWERLEATHGSFLSKLSRFSEKVFAKGPLAIGYAKEIIPLITDQSSS